MYCHSLWRGGGRGEEEKREEGRKERREGNEDGRGGGLGGIGGGEGGREGEGRREPNIWSGGESYLGSEQLSSQRRAVPCTHYNH